MMGTSKTVQTSLIECPHGCGEAVLETTYVTGQAPKYKVICLNSRTEKWMKENGYV